MRELEIEKQAAVALEEVPSDILAVWREQETERLRLKLPLWGKVPRADELVLKYAILRRLQDSMAEHDDNFYQAAARRKMEEEAAREAAVVADPVPSAYVDQCRRLSVVMERLGEVRVPRDMAGAINQACRAIGLPAPIWGKWDKDRLASSLAAMGARPVVVAWLRLAQAGVNHAAILKRLQNHSEYEEPTSWLNNDAVKALVAKYDVPDCWPVYGKLRTAIEQAVARETFGKEP